MKIVPKKGGVWWVPQISEIQIILHPEKKRGFYPNWSLRLGVSKA